MDKCGCKRNPFTDGWSGAAMTIFPPIVICGWIYLSEIRTNDRLAKLEAERAVDKLVVRIRKLEEAHAKANQEKFP